MALLGSNISAWNLLGPLGGLVAGISNASQRPSSSAAQYVQNVAKNFSLPSTRNAYASIGPESPYAGGTYTQLNSAGGGTIVPKASGQSTDPYAGSYSSGGSSGGSYSGTSTGGDTGGSTGPSEQDIMNGYWNQLDAAYNDAISSLSPLRSGQETSAGLSRDQALSQLGSTEAENQALLATQGRKINEGQSSALTNLADNLRNQYQAGNVYLGARGAGDSSAAGMYAYALGRAGTKARGDVLAQTRSLQSDLADREASLGRLVTSEKGRIQSEYAQNLQSIGNWYNQMVSQLQQAKATDRMAMSQEILNRALSAIDVARTNATNMGNALSQWAMNNSTTLGQLKSNLAGAMNVKIPQQGYTLNAGITPMGAGGSGSYFPGQTGTSERRDIYGNIIR